MSTPISADSVEASDDLDRRLDELGKSDPAFSWLITTSKVNRRRVRTLWAVVVGDILLTVAAAVGGFFLIGLLQGAHDQKVATYTACVATNQTRENARGLWFDFIGDFVPKTPLKPDVMARLDKFEGQVMVTYRPQNCGRKP